MLLRRTVSISWKKQEGDRDTVFAHRVGRGELWRASQPGACAGLVLPFLERGG